MALQTVHNDPPRGWYSHKVLIAFAIVALVYCVGAPVIGNLIVQMAP